MEWTGGNVMGWLSSVVGTDIYEGEILGIKDKGILRIIILMNNLVMFYHLKSLQLTLFFYSNTFTFLTIHNSEHHSFIFIVLYSLFALGYEPSLAPKISTYQPTKPRL